MSVMDGEILADVYETGCFCGIVFSWILNVCLRMQALPALRKSLERSRRYFKMEGDK